jgi:photosystem II stability/assembly factor-like uncharacterized protein
VYLREDQTSVGIAIYAKSSGNHWFYFTRDCGKSWLVDDKYGMEFSKRGKQIYDEIENPFDQNVRYRRAIGGPNRDVERSSDGGKTWRRVRGSIKGASTKVLILWPLRFDRSDLSRIYACLELPWSYGTMKHGMFVSQDGGDTFEYLYETEGWCALAIAQSNSKIMYGAGLQGSVLKTENGGGSWRLVDQNDEIRRPMVPLDAKGTSREASILEYGYNDVRSIAINPTNPDQVFLGTGKGVIRTSDGGHSWCVLDLGVPDIGNVSDVVIDPAINRVVYVGGGVGLLKSDDMGCRWQKVDVSRLLSK